MCIRDRAEIVNGFEDFVTRSGFSRVMTVVADTLVSFDGDGIWLSDGQSEPGRFDSFEGRFSGTVVFTDEYVFFTTSAANYIGDPASRELVAVQLDVTDIVGLDTTHVTFTEQELFVGDPLALPEQSLMTFHRILPDPIEFDGLVYFAVEAENGLADVWSTDGTLEGTTQLTDVGFSAARTPITFHAGEENLFITADDGMLGAELWQLEISPDTRGDLNGDGAQDASDIDALFASIRTDENDPEFDVNQDGEVDNLDVDFLLQEVLNRRRGDVNLDGTVGFSDFLVLSQSFGSTGATWSQGDFTGDGEVTFADFLLLSSAFGESTE